MTPPIPIPASLERDLEATRLPRDMLQAANRQGCPVAAIKARLKAAGLRPTRQRMILGWLLFAGVTAMSPPRPCSARSTVFAAISRLPQSTTR